MTTSLETRFCWNGCKANRPVFTTAVGTKVCTYCGEKFPAEFPKADPSSVSASRLDYLQRRVKALEDMASYYHHIPVGDSTVPSLFERMAELERRSNSQDGLIASLRRLVEILDRRR